MARGRCMKWEESIKKEKSHNEERHEGNERHMRCMQHKGFLKGLLPVVNQRFTSMLRNLLISDIFLLISHLRQYLICKHAIIITQNKSSLTFS